MKLYQKTVEELCLLTASKIPTPGGGAISAMNGAFAAALTSMVANLTLERKIRLCSNGNEQNNTGSGDY